MGRSLLAQAFPIDDNVEPITTVSDVVSLAHDLLTFADVTDVLQRAGDSGNFTDQEKDLVDSRLIEAGEHLKMPGHQWDNLNIAIALARRFSSGTIAMEDEKTACAFAEDRLRTFKNEQLHPGWKPLRLSEALDMIESLRVNGDLEPFIQYRNMPDGKNKRKVWETLQHKSYSLAHKESWKFGLANRDKFGFDIVFSVINNYCLNRVDDLDRKTIIHHLRNYQFSDLGKRGHSIDDLKGKE
jgi:hypothetical protein